MLDDYAEELTDEQVYHEQERLRKHQLDAEAVQAGQLAGVLRASLSSALAALHERTLAEMLSAFRASQLDERKLYGLVAKLAAYDDFKQLLDTQITKGRAAAKELRHGEESEGAE